MKKVVFMYPDIASHAVEKLVSGEFPRERLHGYYQLRELGWDVSISDARWKGPLANIRRRLKRYFELPSIGTLREWRSAEIIVVKDDFSLTLTLLAKLLRKKIVYLDSMFAIPDSRIRRRLKSWNIRLADLVICFSESQADLWSQTLEIDRNLFHVLRYSMDIDFYSRHRKAASLPQTSTRSTVISVGRDLGRDFSTLIQSLRHSDVSIRLVTLPYLLPAIGTMKNNDIEVYENLSYEDLFELYRNATIAAVPLVNGVTYPSGIRAIMEAMLFGIPVIATWTPVLVEYFSNEKHLILVEPQSPDAMRSAVEELMANDVRAEQLAGNALKTMQANFSVRTYGGSLADLLETLAP